MSTETLIEQKPGAVTREGWGGVDISREQEPGGLSREGWDDVGDGGSDG